MALMVPESCVPTAIVFCGLTVPVAVTDCTSVWFATGTVVNVTAADDRARTSTIADATIATARTAATTAIQRRRLDFAGNANVSIVAVWPFVAGGRKSFIMVHLPRVVVHHVQLGKRSERA